MSNVILISIDALRIDHVGCFNSDAKNRNTTPNIDELSEDSMKFKCYANGIPTFHAFKSIFSSMYPLEKPGGGLPKLRKSLTEILSEEGFKTAAFTGGNPWLTPYYDYDRGFDHYKDYLSKEKKKKTKWKILRLIEKNEKLKDIIGYLGRIISVYTNDLPLTPAKKMNKDALNWLESNKDQDFFLWMHYMEPHYPWAPKKEFLDKEKISNWEIGKLWHKVSYLNKKDYSRKEVSKEEMEKIHKLYDGEVRTVDKYIGNLIKYLKDEDLYDDTVLVVTSDHGTELLDHGGFSHGPIRLYEEIIKTPLIMKVLEDHSNSVRESEHIDITPTILDILNIDYKGKFEGNSLLNKNNGSIFTECIFDYEPTDGKAENDILISCKNDKWKLIQDRENDVEELYNLSDDPNEKINLLSDLGDLKDILNDEIGKHLKYVRTRNVEKEKKRIKSRIEDLNS